MTRTKFIGALRQAVDRVSLQGPSLNSHSIAFREKALEAAQRYKIVETIDQNVDSPIIRAILHFCREGFTSEARPDVLLGIQFADGAWDYYDEHQPKGAGGVIEVP